MHKEKQKVFSGEVLPAFLYFYCFLLSRNSYRQACTSSRLPVCFPSSSDSLRNRGPLRPLEAIADGNLLLQIFIVLTKCALEKANPMGASDHAVSKCSDRRIFRAGSALAQTLFLLRPERILKGGRLCRQRLP